MDDISKVIMLQAELIEKLLELNRETISLLSQYMVAQNAQPMHFTGSVITAGE